MIRVQNLYKDFYMHIRGGKKIVSLEDVSFRLKKGEFLGITGPSGIGKSSLLKCIYRTYIPTSGDIWYTSAAGETINLSQADDHQILYLRDNEMRMISQFFHVIPRVSAIDIVADALTSTGCDKNTGRDRARELLIRIGIPESLWEMYPSTFSGGEKQRLNIIHAVITKPRLLLLDEPTASLDPKSKSEAIGLILELKKAGTAMLGVFHDYDTMKKIADSQLELKVQEREEKYA